MSIFPVTVIFLTEPLRIPASAPTDSALDINDIETFSSFKSLTVALSLTVSKRPAFLPESEVIVRFLIVWPLPIRRPSRLAIGVHSVPLRSISASSRYVPLGSLAIAFKPSTLEIRVELRTVSLW